MTSHFCTIFSRFFCSLNGLSLAAKEHEREQEEVTLRSLRWLIVVWKTGVLRKSWVFVWEIEQKFRLFLAKDHKDELAVICV